MRRIAGFLSAALVVLLTASISTGIALGQSEEPMRLPVDPAPLIVETASGQQEFTIEVADEEAERSRGLMFRRDLPERRGMLFVFEQTRGAGFWMKNTPLPLDLVFIGEDGRVRATLRGEPFSEARISPRVPVRFVLEVHEGTAEELGIEPGDRLRHPEIDAIAGSD